MARKIEVQILGDASSLTRAFNQGGLGARRFNATVTSSLGSVAKRFAAFGGVALGAGLVGGLEKATHAAIQHQAAEAQLGAALKTAGLQFGTYGGQIDRALVSQRLLSGFTENETVQAFTRLVRTSRDVPKALKDTALAANIARGANIPLAAATAVVNKVLAGQLTGLKRLGVEIPKGTSRYQALEIASRKFAGSSAAFAGTAAGAQARLTQAIHQSEIAIGNGLLPIQAKVADSLARWISKSENQKMLQLEVAKAVHTGTQAVAGLKAAFDVVSGPVQLATKALGGTKHAIEALALLTVARRVETFANSFTVLASSEKAAATNATVLGGRLKALPTKIAISVIVASEITGPMKKLFEQAFGADFSGTTPGGGVFHQKAGKIVTQFDGSVMVIGPDHKAYSPDQYRAKFGVKAISKRIFGSSTGAAFSPASASKRTAKQITQANQFFDAMIGRKEARVQDVASLSGQLQSLGLISGLLTQRLSKTKDITRRLKLEDDLLGVTRASKAVRQQIAQGFLDSLSLSLEKAQATAGLRDDLAALEKINTNIRAQIRETGRTADLERQLFENQQQIQQTRLEQRNQRQFKALGLGPTGDALAPTVAALRKQLGSAEAAVKGTFLDTSKTSKLFDGITKVLSHRFGNLSDDMKNRVRDLLTELTGQLDAGSNKLGRKTKTTALTVLDTSKIAANVNGLSTDQIRALRAQLAKFTTAASFSGQSFGGGATTGALAGVAGGRHDVHVHVNLDRREIATAVATDVTNWQQKRERRNPMQRRGT